MQIPILFHSNQDSPIVFIPAGTFKAVVYGGECDLADGELVESVGQSIQIANKGPKTTCFLVKEK